MNQVNSKYKLPLYSAIENRATNDVSDIHALYCIVSERFLSYITDKHAAITSGRGYCDHVSLLAGWLVGLLRSL